MKYIPYEYQKYCIQFILNHPIVALFLEQGMGKTGIALSSIKELIQRNEIRKVLIVAPLRVAKFSWQNEIQKFDEFQCLSYSLVLGSRKKRMEALKAKTDLYLINRENLQWLIDKSGMPFDFDMVIIDELSSFKNYKTKRFKAFIKVRPKVRRVIGLTGTPATKSLENLFAEFMVLDMGERLSSSITEFRDRYFRPGRRKGNIIYEYILRPGADKLIYDKISDITVSMKSIDYLKMPKLISVEYPVNMSKEEMNQYENMKRNLVLSLTDKDITAANAATLSGKLCQLSNGAIYTEEKDFVEIHRRKLDALEDIIESANDKPLLVAYWFHHDLKRIIRRLDEIKVNHSMINDADSIKNWNAGNIQVGLIHPASCGLGINLQEGSNLIVWFSLPWSLELYQQTNSRLWRNGQKEKTVVVQHIVTKGTIDERILYLLENKNQTQEALIAAVKADLKVKENPSFS